MTYVCISCMRDYEEMDATLPFVHPEVLLSVLFSPTSPYSDLRTQYRLQNPGQSPPNISR
jgi:hypothetical protein